MRLVIFFSIFIGVILLLGCSKEQIKENADQAVKNQPITPKGD
jgi:hypothetical protein